MGVELEIFEFSKLKGAAITCILFSNALFLIPFVSPTWAIPANRDSDIHVEGIGLWNFCQQTGFGEDSISCPSLVSRDIPDWFRASQATLAIAFVLMFAALGLAIATECVKKCRANRRLLLIFIATNLSAVGFGTIGLSIFGVEIERHMVVGGWWNGVTLTLSWGFIMAAMGTALHGIAGVFAILEYILSGRRPLPVMSFTNPSAVDMGKQSNYNGTGDSSQQYEDLDRTVDT